MGPRKGRVGHALHVDVHLEPEREAAAVVSLLVAAAGSAGRCSCSARLSRLLSFGGRRGLKRTTGRAMGICHDR